MNMSPNPLSMPDLVLAAGVSNARLLDLQAEVYRQQEHVRLVAEGVLPAELRDRRKAGTDVSCMFDRQNAGVATRQARDQLHVKAGLHA